MNPRSPNLAYVEALLRVLTRKAVGEEWTSREALACREALREIQILVKPIDTHLKSA